MKTSLTKSLIAFLLVCWLGLTPLTSPARADEGILDIYFYHSKTCPHCLKQKPVMEYIDEHNRAVRLHSYEVHDNPAAWQEFLEKYQLPSAAVPRTLIGDKIFVGYSEGEGNLEYIPVHKSYLGYKNQIIKAIEEALGRSINIPGKDVNHPKGLPWKIVFFPMVYGLTYPLFKTKLKTEVSKRYWVGGLGASIIVTLLTFLSLTPEVVIKQFAQSLPFPLFVFIIALADGFNPCAFTVLIILLSLLTYTKSRKDMTLVGSTFILTSALMYFLFIMLMIAVGSIFIERWGTLFLLLLGVLITLAGAINLKDYFWFKQGVSLSLNENQQRVISQKAGRISRDLQGAKQDKKLFWLALGGTILLAIFVNLVELGCTAILPVVYLTSLLQYCRDGFWLCSYFWTGIYAAIYVIPLLAILGNFIYFFKSSRLTEQQGRLLKLVGGLFMLFFGLVMIFRPEFLSFG
jgi:glutaredoxin